jgi:hypothetical protein
MRSSRLCSVIFNRHAIAIYLLLIVTLLNASSSAQTFPTTRPTRQRTVVVTTQPVQVPYTLTDTNHLLVRLKINGKGPFNFIVDTGAPVMVLRTSAADMLGLKSDSRGFATLDQLEIEGGVLLKHVSCLVETPYQIEGMNAIGASSVDLDGMLGYAVLARFRMQIDLTKDRMVWTPAHYSPPRLDLMRTADREPDDAKEDRLESVGGLLKFLGPLIKPDAVEPKYRGSLGIELTENSQGVSISSVLGESPAAKAGLSAGDSIVALNKTPVHTIADAQNAMSNVLAGQSVLISIRRAAATMQLHLTSAEGM